MQTKESTTHHHLGCRIIVEETELSFGAHSPDIPGIGCIGADGDEALEFMKEAIARSLKDRIVADGRKTVIRGTGINPAFVVSLLSKGYTENSLAMFLGIAIADVKACVSHCASD